MTSFARAKSTTKKTRESRKENRRRRKFLSIACSLEKATRWRERSFWKSLFGYKNGNLRTACLEYGKYIRLWWFFLEKIMKHLRLWIMSERKRIYTRRSLPATPPHRSDCEWNREYGKKCCFSVWDAEVLGLWSFLCEIFRLFISDTSRAINTVTVLESLLALNPRLKAVPFYFPSKKVTHFSSCGLCRCLFFVVNSVSMTLPYSLSGVAASPLCVRSLCVCTRKWDPWWSSGHASAAPTLSGRPLAQGTCWLRQRRFVKPFRTSFVLSSPHCHTRAQTFSTPRARYQSAESASLDRLEWRTFRSRRRQKSFRLMLQHVNRIPCDLLAHGGVGVLERPHSIHRKATLKLNFSASVYFYLIKAVMDGSDGLFIKFHYVMDA